MGSLRFVAPAPSCYDLGHAMPYTTILKTGFLLAGLILGGAGDNAFACTEFQLAASPSKVMANSFDWYYGHGMLVQNQRGVAKKALTLKPQETPMSWVSKYGSVTFNPVGREFPKSGINEKGLVIDALWLEETRYPGASESRPAIDELQWIQYLLDVSASVDEAVENSKNVSISGVIAKIHYMACDASGECAVFEYLDGQPVVHAKKSLGVAALTNNTYDSSVASLGTDPSAQEDFSLVRFARAAAAVSAYKPGTDEVAYAFSVLESVKQFDTRWAQVYDPVRRTIYFRTDVRPQTAIVDLKSFDFDCRTPVRVLDVNTPRSGNVSAAFGPYSAEQNKQLVEKNRRLIPSGPAMQSIAAYPETSTHCQVR
jgi:penicillin V acylase-like amidase (Ntn superfamily)